ncbi:hypothetical protein GCK72_002422 [Caenorhabditis remanei]|uniref:Uncharacterized protein n=1 Tax=Caenorhabditis remanei TaxID=31234 RepID=E3LVX6_CAERE|nr:hypothetical protein GCK72_002422 [Caenorhabditis remanei]EFP12501.1 hypothetical protein CRE_29601 [Caenorhabditis remanei]KAF1770603.1 hypothetical protein GCK72_002422 [Caenorhabditis remanei]
MYADISAKSQLDVIRNVASIVRNSALSTPYCFVPRLRVSFKNVDRCLFVIYSDVEKFLRVEFRKESDGIVIKRMMNSYDENDSVAEKIDGTTPISLATSILATAVMDRPLGVLEIEFFDPNPQEQRKIFNEMLKTLQSKIEGFRYYFRPQKFVANCLTDGEIFTSFHEEMLDLIRLKESAMETISMENHSLEPRSLIDTTSFMDDIQVALSGTELFSTKPDERYLSNLMVQALNTDGFATLRFARKSDAGWWNKQKGKVFILNDSVLMKRVTLSDNLVAHWNLSECGLWVDISTLKNERKYWSCFEKEKCGLRSFCQKCAHRFDYWFYRDLPRRIINEPEWVIVREEKKDEKEKSGEEEATDTWEEMEFVDEFDQMEAFGCSAKMEKPIWSERLLKKLI